MAKKENLSIVPECWVETAMGKAFAYTDNVNHQVGIGAVSNAINKKALKDDFAIGMIDDDGQKRMPSDVKKYHQLAKVDMGTDKKGKEVSYELLQDGDSLHFIFRVHPAMEQIMITAAEEMGCTLSDFGLPVEMDELKKITKNEECIRNEDVHKFFNAIRKAGDDSSMSRYFQAFSYLNENRYDENIAANATDIMEGRKTYTSGYGKSGQLTDKP